ncbi:hypothetical protein ABZ341_08845 [Streptomyces sp. NPDC006173]|uniref:hypothetical protein n=1 Tax=unclassified Streptomyces TaxID=2593676 RepID=UPI0033D1F22B
MTFEARRALSSETGTAAGAAVSAATPPSRIAALEEEPHALAVTGTYRALPAPAR